MTRKIEIFSAGCSVCENLVEQVHDAACSSCDIQVLDMKSPDIQERAAGLGIKSVPAVVIDGKLADCCAGRGVDLNVLRSAGLGQPLE
jgi:predicted thioredoxin/glutaredoxin